MTGSPLNLTRSQILSFRRKVGALDERLPPGRRSLRRAGWAGLKDKTKPGALPLPGVDEVTVIWES